MSWPGGGFGLKQRDNESSRRPFLTACCGRTGVLLGAVHSLLGWRSVCILSLCTCATAYPPAAGNIGDHPGEAAALSPLPLQPGSAAVSHTWAGGDTICDLHSVTARPHAGRFQQMFALD